MLMFGKTPKKKRFSPYYQFFMSRYFLRQNLPLTKEVFKRFEDDKQRPKHTLILFEYVTDT